MDTSQAHHEVLLAWTQEMSVGVSVIDEEHRHLIGMINDLYNGVREGKGHEVLGEVLDRLIFYTMAHFQHEEAFFEQTGYPGAEEHKKQHAELTKRALEIQEKYKTESTAVLTLEVMTFLKGWLVNHIQGTDKLYTEHFHASGIH